MPFIVGMMPPPNVFSKVDEVLVRFSRLFGTGIKAPHYQLGMLVFSFGIIHSAAFFLTSSLAWIMLWLGFIGVIGVGRAWVSNEKLRTKIARKLSDADPDELPDLRISALLSAIQLFLIIPRLLKSSHEIFGLYRVPDDAGLMDWMLLGVDETAYGVRFSGIY